MISKKIISLAREVHIISLVFIIAIAAHTSYLSNDFTWLDHGDITAKRAILPLTHIWRAPITRFGTTAFFRPMVTLLHSFDHAVYNQNSFGFHLTNVLLHAFTTVVVFYFLRLYFELNNLLSGLGAIIFAVHPLSWLPVGAISYRQEIALVLFLLLSLILHLQLLVRPSPKLTAVAGIALACALWSKETALLMFPLLFGLYVWSKRRQLIQHRMSLFAILIIDIIIGLLYVAMRYYAVPEGWRTLPISLPPEQAIATRFTAITRLLITLVSPTLPSLSDATPISTFAHSTAWLGLVIVGLLLIIMCKKGIVSLPGRALTFLLITLIPAFNLVPLPRFSSPHYGYVSVVAVSALISMFLKTAIKKTRVRVLATFMLAVWLMWMSVTTFLGGYRFRNDITLFSPEVSQDPHFREGLFYLGNQALAAGNYSVAATQYEQARNPNPHFIAYADQEALYINLSIAYIHSNRSTEAISLLQTLLNHNPNNLDAAYNLARLYYNLGQSDNSEAIINKYLKPVVISPRP